MTYQIYMWAFSYKEHRERWFWIRRHVDKCVADSYIKMYRERGYSVRVNDRQVYLWNSGELPLPTLTA